MTLGLLAGCPTTGEVGNLSPTDMFGGVLGLGGGEKKPEKPVWAGEPYGAVPMLDGWHPVSYVPGRKLKRDAKGNFVLHRGNAYKLTLWSYCLKLGGHQSPGKYGYFAAPLQGKHGSIIYAIINRKPKDKSINQSLRQLLIWDVLSGAPYTSYAYYSKDTAQKLLTPSEIALLGGGPASAGGSLTGLFSSAAKDRIRSNMPGPLKNLLARQDQYRQMMARGNATYGQLEDVAVQKGTPESMPQDRPIPKDRWSLAPGGYFIHYISNGYTRLTVQIAYPRRYDIKRDKLGRIASISSADGFRIETSYDDRVGAIEVPGHPDLAAYLYRRIKVVVPRGRGHKTFKRTWRNTGWTLKSLPSGVKARPLASIGLQVADAGTNIDGEFLQLAQATNVYNRVTDLKERADEVQDRYETYRNYANTAAGNVDNNAVDNLLDQDHYRDGINSVLQGDRGAQLENIAETQRRAADATNYSISVLNGLPTTSNTDTTEYNPTSTVASPGSASSQPLASSSGGDDITPVELPPLAPYGG